MLEAREQREGGGPGHAGLVRPRTEQASALEVGRGESVVAGRGGLQAEARAIGRGRTPRLVLLLAMVLSVGMGASYYYKPIYQPHGQDPKPLSAAHRSP